MSKAEGPVRIWIKPKVLAGFAIILAFAIASIYITYNGFVELLATRQSLSHPNKKLVTLNSALADIYEAESNIRAYNLSQNEDYLNYYFSFLLKVNDKVDSLLFLTKDNSSQRSKIKTIKQLLESKEKVLNEFIDLKKKDRSSIFYDRALEEIARVQSDLNIRKPVVAKTTTTTTSKRDTVLERLSNQKTGFFGKIKSWISGKEKVDTSYTDIIVETRVDTLVRSGYVSDSIMGSVVGILNQIKLEQESARELAGTKELELLKSDKELMDQIRVIVSLLEREELSQSYKRANNAEEVVHKSTIIVLALGGAALIMLLLFVAVIFRDITKGNYYRNELYEAKKYAEKLLKVKEQFLANMSHEIRTPLSSIIGLSRQMERTDLSQKQTDYVKLLSSSSNHLLSVINDILDFSKIEAGQMRIESLPFKLSEVIQESLNYMQDRATEKGIGLEIVDSSTENITIWGDPFRLKQILLNLLSNAIKFTGKGSVTISSGYSNINEEFTKISITVRDTGIGIPQEKQSLIFEEFTQADPGTTRRFGGTGLGLTIVKKLTELQGGEVTIDSMIDVGTSISIAIPYRLKGEPAKSPHESYAPLHLNKEIRVLIVDDDDVNRIISEELFKHIGLAVDSTGEPANVLDLLSKKEYNIVLTDIHMPGISGYDIVEQINGTGISIPVIAITANSTIDNPNHFAEKGFSGYLIKPYTEDDVLKVIEPFIGVQNTAYTTTVESSGNESDLGYDLTDIFRFSGGDMQSARLILSTFLENTDKNLNELNNHVHRKDIKNASAIAHKMKSAFNQFKVYNIAGLLLKIEKTEERADKPNEVKELTEELNIQIKPIIKLLRKELMKMEENG